MGAWGAERRSDSIMKSPQIEALGSLFLLFCLAAALLAAPPARAAEPDLVTFNVGPIEIVDPETRLQIGAELRFPPMRIRWLPRFLPELSPVAGGLFASRGTLYVYGGLRYDLPLPGSWSLSPQLAAGLYSHEQGIDLGGALEFRSGLELSRDFRGGRSRAGLLLFHLSNGHLYSHNPGTEGLAFTYSLRP
jgi:lipid A 3-O-deacylase